MQATQGTTPVPLFDPEETKEMTAFDYVAMVTGFILQTLVLERALLSSVSYSLYEFWCKVKNSDLFIKTDLTRPHAEY